MPFRKLGLGVGRFPVGKWNAITDVPGVRVGHFTKILGEDCRSGVTAIVPAENIFQRKLPAAAFVLNGAGECTGLLQIMEWGRMESPILLTNSSSVGLGHAALLKWLRTKNPSLASGDEVVIPVVAECDDSFLHNSNHESFAAEDVRNLLNSVSTGAVEQGNVGGGTGMICCDFKAGIGSSSRKMELNQNSGHLGVLLQNNFGVQRDLRILGRPIGVELGEYFKREKIPRDLREKNAGSLICVVATDLPLGVKDLERLAKRAALGVGRTGSIAAHNSGEFFIAFSTAASATPTNFSEDDLDALFEAVIECTEEAVYNSLVAAEDMSGRNAREVRAVPKNELSRLLAGAGRG